MSVAFVAGTTMPFLGLHFYDEDDEPLFFGRDEQIRDALAKVAEARFVTVIGSSGSGKSSLVRAGVIPALRAGFITGAGASWRVVKSHPGQTPIHTLAEEIEHVLGGAGAETTLRRGPLGLVEAIGQAGIESDENVLVLIDQFEEIFRYQRDAPDRAQAAEEAAAFVKLLLEATARPAPSIYVLITMRSEYLGACAQFRDLPERINAGLYLVPRMRRDQLEEAITGPAGSSSRRPWSSACSTTSARIPTSCLCSSMPSCERGRLGGWTRRGRRTSIFATTTPWAAFAKASTSTARRSTATSPRKTAPSPKRSSAA
jgi:energy-coupling factor transporter ATP-binding protein EcfA2